MIETASNRLVFLPYEHTRPVGKGIIVKNTTKLTLEKTESGIIFSENSRPTRKYDVGIVHSIGKDVQEVRVGDLVVYQSAGSVAFPLPNGMKDAEYVKIEETPVIIMAVVKADKVKDLPADFSGDFSTLGD